MNSDRAPNLWEKFKILAFFCFPHQWLSRFVFFMARVKTHRKNILIKRYINFFGVNMSEAEYTQPENYATFNDFFTRRLKAEARIVCNDPRTFACPCDGMILESGDVQDDTLLQAKGQRYTLHDLFGDTDDCADNFVNGKFITIYLSPCDYHRVHMPVDGRLTNLIHIPGKLFSVAPYALKLISRLYTRNERVITIFETKLGKIAIVMVGALNVGSISIRHRGTVTPRSQAIEHTHYLPIPSINAQQIYFKRGEEIGRFNLGSTVILLTKNPHIQWNPAYAAGNIVRMGEELACHIKKSED